MPHTHTTLSKPNKKPTQINILEPTIPNEESLIEFFSEEDNDDMDDFQQPPQPTCECDQPSSLESEASIDEKPNLENFLKVYQKEDKEIIKAKLTCSSFMKKQVFQVSNELYNSRNTFKTPHFEKIDSNKHNYHRVLASDLITNSVRTPCDRSEWIQVVKNPSDPNSVIAVQKVKKNLQHFKLQNADQSFLNQDAQSQSVSLDQQSQLKQSPRFLRSPKKDCEDHNLVNYEIYSKDSYSIMMRSIKVSLQQKVLKSQGKKEIITQNQKCSFCELLYCYKELLYCLKCRKYECFLCSALVKQIDKTKQKTWQHGYFNPYVLEVKSLEPSKSSQDLSLIETQTSDKNSENSAIVSFWYFSQKNKEFDCQYQFEIQNPKFEENQFLFERESGKQLVYIVKDGEQEQIEEKKYILQTDLSSLQKEQFFQPNQSMNNLLQEPKKPINNLLQESKKTFCLEGSRSEHHQLPSQTSQLNYPLLLHTNPIKDKIYLANLVQNVEQIEIDLNLNKKGLKVVRILESGGIAYQVQEDFEMYRFDILVQDTNYRPYILQISLNPWVEDGKPSMILKSVCNSSESTDEFLNQIGCGFGRLKQSILLYQKHQQKHKRWDYLVLLFDRGSKKELTLQVFDFQNDQLKQLEHQTQENLQIKPIKMVLGNFQEVYYVCEIAEESKFQIRKISRNQNKRLVDEEFYETKNTILSIQQDMEVFRSKEIAKAKCKMFILDHLQLLQAEIFPEQLKLKASQLKISPLNQILADDQQTQNLIYSLKNGRFVQILLSRTGITTFSQNFSQENESKSKKKKQHLKQLLFFSGNLISSMPFVHIKHSYVKAIGVNSFETQYKTQKNVFHIENNEDESYFLTSIDQNSRTVSFMDAFRSAHYIQQIHMTEERIFLFVDKVKYFSPNSTQPSCIEIDRKTQQFVQLHQNVSEVLLSNQGSLQNNDLVCLVNKIDHRIKVIQPTSICQKCKTGNGNIAFYEVQLTIVDKKQNKNNSFVSLVSGLNQQKYLVIKKQEVQLEHLKVLIYKFGGLIFGKEKRQANTNSSSENNDYLQVLFTRNYTVIRAGQEVHFYHKEDLLKNDQDEFFVQNLQRIPFDSLTCAAEAQKFLHIQDCEDYNYKYFDHQDRSSDLIQISLKARILIWDLTFNQQIYCLENFQTFFQQENFYFNTGCSLFRTFTSVQKKGLQRTQLYQLLQTKDQQLYCLPYSEDKDGVGYFFRTFNNQSLNEIIYLLSEVNNSSSKKIGSLNALLTDVEDITFLETFINSAIIFQTINYFKVQVKQAEQVSIFGVEFFKNGLRQSTNLIKKPTTNLNFFSEANQKTTNLLSGGGRQRPNFRRNIIQRILRYLIFSVQDQQIKLQTQNFIVFLSLIVQFQDLFKMSNLVCTTSEFWYFYSDLSDFQEVKTFCFNWKKSNIVHKNLKMQWNPQIKRITFGCFSDELDVHHIEQDVQSCSQSYIDRAICYFKTKTKWKKLGKFFAFQLQFLKKRVKSLRVRKTTIAVNVRCYQIEWLRKNEMVLYEKLGDEESLDLYRDEFILDFLTAKSPKTQLIWVGLVPYFSYSFLVLQFYINQGKVKDQAVGLIMLNIAYLLLLEVSQLKKVGLISYLQDQWNMIMLSTYTLSLISICMEMAYFHKLALKSVEEMNEVGISEFQVQLFVYTASLNSFIIVLGGFYWCQMFNQISMYWRIIIDSMTSSRYFTFMVTIILGAFAAAVYILDQQQQRMFRLQMRPYYHEETDDYEELTQDKFQVEIIDASMTQYLLMLGEFEFLGAESLSNYPKISQYLLWLYFFLATFVSQIVFFNVLVAVLSEEYSSRWVFKDEYALNQQVKVISDYIQLLNVQLPCYNFLYVVEPSADLEEESELQQVKLEILKQNERSLNEMSEQNSQFKTELAQMKRGFEEKIDDVSEGLNQKMKELNEKLDKLIDAQQKV